MEPIEQLGYILPTVSATVDRIQTMQMNNPTPCPGFTVHDVLDRMIVLGESFAHWFRGEPAPDLNPPPVYGWVPAGELRKTMDDLLAAAKSPGALDRMVTTSIGAMAGSTFARFVALNGLVHGWDLASSTGQRFAVPPAVIRSVDEFARGGLRPEIREIDSFRETTTAPDDARALEHLMAFSGRSL